MIKKLQIPIIVFIIIFSLTVGWLAYEFVGLYSSFAITLAMILLLCLLSANFLALMFEETKTISAGINNLRKRDFVKIDDQLNKTKQELRQLKTNIKNMTEQAMEPVIVEIERLMEKDDKHDAGIKQIHDLLNMEFGEQKAQANICADDSTRQQHLETKSELITKDLTDLTKDKKSDSAVDDYITADCAVADSDKCEIPRQPLYDQGSDDDDNEKRQYLPADDKRLKPLKHREKFEELSIAFANGDYNSFMQPLVSMTADGDSGDEPCNSGLFYEVDLRVKFANGDKISVTAFSEFWRDSIFAQIDAMMVRRTKVLLAKLHRRDKSINFIIPLSRHFIAVKSSFDRIYQQLLALHNSYDDSTSSIIIRPLFADYMSLNTYERNRLTLLVELGYRFCFDQAANLYFDPGRMASEGAAFVRMPFTMLAGKGLQYGDIHPKDVTVLLHRFNIDTIISGINDQTALEQAYDFGVDWGIGENLAISREIPEGLFVSRDDSNINQAAG